MDLLVPYDFSPVTETLKRIYNQGIPLLGIIISCTSFVLAIDKFRTYRLKTPNYVHLAGYILYGLTAVGVFIIGCVWVDSFWGAIMGI
jgi:hypothetical protein